MTSQPTEGAASVEKGNRQQGSAPRTSAVGSRLVSVIAWLGIVLAGAGILASLGQILHLYDLRTGSTAASSDLAQAPEGTEAGAEEAAPTASFTTFLGTLAAGTTSTAGLRVRGIVGNYPWPTLVVLGAFLVSSWGLLKRRNWARFAILAFLALAGVWSLVGVYLTVRELVLSADMLRGIRDEAASIRAVVIAQSVLSLLQSLVTLLLLSWVAGKLTGPESKNEFAGSA